MVQWMGRRPAQLQRLPTYRKWVADCSSKRPVKSWPRLAASGLEAAGWSQTSLPYRVLREALCHEAGLKVNWTFDPQPQRADRCPYVHQTVQIADQRFCASCASPQSRRRRPTTAASLHSYAGAGPSTPLRQMDSHWKCELLRKWQIVSGHCRPKQQDFRPNL